MNVFYILAPEMLPLDLYFEIALHIPVAKLRNLFMVIRNVSTAHFWNRRLILDYNVTYFPPNCCNLELYKKYYQFNFGHAKVVKCKSAYHVSKSIRNKYLSYGDIANVNNELHFINRRISISGKIPYVIPIKTHLRLYMNTLQIIEEYPIDYWKDIFDAYEAYFDATPYLDQINKNMIFSDNQYQSTFIDWRGKEYTIIFEDRINYLTKYKISGNTLTHNTLYDDQELIRGHIHNINMEPVMYVGTPLQ